MIRTVIFLISLIISEFSFSQSLNHIELDKKGNEVLLGKINKNGLTKNSFNQWFSKNHKDYLVNKKVVNLIKDSIDQYQVKVFLGTWCGDSKREVPRFYKVLEAANFPEKQLQVIGVDKTEDAYKQSPGGEEKGLNIHRVPTFIFYKNGKEINRIVESPKETLERDILNILSANKYSPNYPVVNYMHHLLKTKSLDSLKLKTTSLIPRLSEFIKGSRELNTYGYLLLRSNQLEKALYIFDLNTKIFPYKSNVYDSLGEAYFITKNYSEALKNYYKVLSLKPHEENAMKMIDKIKLLIPSSKKS